MIIPALLITLALTTTPCYGGGDVVQLPGNQGTLIKQADGTWAFAANKANPWTSAKKTSNGAWQFASDRNNPAFGAMSQKEVNEASQKLVDDLYASGASFTPSRREPQRSSQGYPSAYPQPPRGRQDYGNRGYSDYSSPGYANSQFSQPATGSDQYGSSRFEPSRDTRYNPWNQRDSGRAATPPQNSYDRPAPASPLQNPYARPPPAFPQRSSYTRPEPASPPQSSYAQPTADDRSAMDRFNRIAGGGRTASIPSGRASPGYAQTPPAGYNSNPPSYDRPADSRTAKPYSDGQAAPPGLFGGGNSDDHDDDNNGSPTLGGIFGGGQDNGPQGSRQGAPPPSPTGSTGDGAAEIADAIVKEIKAFTERTHSINTEACPEIVANVLKNYEPSLKKMKRTDPTLLDVMPDWRNKYHAKLQNLLLGLPINKADIPEYLKAFTVFTEESLRMKLVMTRP